VRGGYSHFYRLARGALHAFENRQRGRRSAFRSQNGLRELVSYLKEDVFLLSGSVGAREAFIKSDQPLIERFLRATIKGQLYTQQNRAGALPYVSKTLKVKDDHAQKIFDLSLPGFTRGRYVEESLQKEAYRQAVERLAIKEPPPLDRAFNYGLTRRILADLETKGWKP
jgi:hypothetical protein